MTWEALCSLHLSQFKPATRGTYQHAIKQYTVWCGEQKLDPFAAGRTHLQAYLAHLIERGYAQATVSNRFGAVYVLYRTAVEEDLITKNPAKKVKVPAIDRAAQSRTVLTPLEYAAFLRAAEATGPTEHAIAALGGMVGLRVSEMTQLDASNIGSSRGYVTITVLSKGEKTHVIPLPIPVMRPVLLLAELCPTGALLRNKAGERMDRRDLNRCVKRMGEQAGISHNITPHGLRRTYATSGFMKGVSLRDMQIAMRHARSETTLLYDLDRQNLDRHASHEIAAFLSGFAQ